MSDFRCRASNHYGDPIECDWPHCGCDPKATKVVETLVESGWGDTWPWFHAVRDLLERVDAGDNLIIQLEKLGRLRRAGQPRAHAVDAEIVEQPPARADGLDVFRQLATDHRRRLPRRLKGPGQICRC